MRKKLVSTLLAMCLLAAISPHVSAKEASFSDTSGHWAEAQIEIWAERGIIQGNNGDFLPNAYITRGAVAAIIDRIMKYTRASESSFPDLDATSYCAEPIRKLAHAGIMQGYADGTVHPNNFITRQEAVVMLSRAFRVPERSNAALLYKDKDSISPFAVEAVRAFTAMGYIHGNQANMFRPKDPITRAEFVTVLNNMISDIVSTNKTPQKKSGKIVVINQPGTSVSDIEADTLFISAGAAEGDITLNNVKADKLFVLGGGIHSVLIKGNTSIRVIQIAKQDSGVRVSVSKDSEVEIVQVQDGCDDVILSGTFQNIAIDSSKNTIQLSGATVNNLTIAGAGTKVAIDKDSTVKSLAIAASATQAEVDTKGKIGTVTVDNDSAKVTTSGSGSTGGGSSGGSSSGGSSTGGGSTGGGDTPDKPVTNIFGLTIIVSGGGSVYAEEIETPTEPEPEPEPEPPVIDPIDPEVDGYPLIIQTGGHGLAIAEEVTEPVTPKPEPEEPSEYIVRIQVSGQGTVVIQEIGE